MALLATAGIASTARVVQRESHVFPHYFQVLNKGVDHLLRVERRWSDAKPFLAFGYCRVINCLHVMSKPRQQFIADTRANPRIADQNGNNMTGALHLRQTSAFQRILHISDSLLMTRPQSHTFFTFQDLPYILLRHCWEQSILTWTEVSAPFRTVGGKEVVNMKPAA